MFFSWVDWLQITHAVPNTGAVLKCWLSHAWTYILICSLVILQHPNYSQFSINDLLFWTVLFQTILSLCSQIWIYKKCTLSSNTKVFFQASIWKTIDHWLLLIFKSVLITLLMKKKERKGTKKGFPLKKPWLHTHTPRYTLLSSQTRCNGIFLAL